MKLTTSNLGEIIAVIQIRYNFSLKNLSDILDVHPSTLSAKIRSNKFNGTERNSILCWIRDNGLI